MHHVQNIVFINYFKAMSNDNVIESVKMKNIYMILVSTKSG